jgi:hypothetical protein
MILTLSHELYKKPTPGSIYKSRFVLGTEDGVIGQMMTEKQAKAVIKGLGFEWPTDSKCTPWTLWNVEIGG